MGMPGRKYTNGSGYRYGFNGKEKSDPEGNGYDFGARVQNPRLGGRFFSTDPMTAINPGESPYTFAGNNPIALTDFDGLFKISPYFAKKYPTLAKIIEHVLPLYINNITARDNWISNIGFENKQAGIAAWEEMLTYGKGPWITPTMTENELTKNGGKTGLSLFLGRFGDGSGNEWNKQFGYADNISFESFNLKRLETALNAGNDEEVVFNAFRVMILIMHESGHWARSERAHKPNRTGGVGEDGARAEEAVFGRRFSYTNNLKAGVNADAIRDDLVRQFSSGFSFIWKLATGVTFTNVLQKLSKSQGQAGDPVLKAAKIKEGKVFNSKGTSNTGTNSSSKNRDYSY